jgi:NADH:ubiquinone oxidoreductase subunit 6 (subunit J)
MRFDRLGIAVLLRLRCPWRWCHWTDDATECWQRGPVYVLRNRPTYLGPSHSGYLPPPFKRSDAGSNPAGPTNFMMQRFYHLDHRILGRFVRLAHAIQRLTGLLSYRVAACALELTVVMSIVTIVDRWFPGLLTRETPDVVVAVACFAVIVWLNWARLARGAEREFLEKPDRIPQAVGELFFPLYHVIVGMRVMLLCLGVLAAVALAFDQREFTWLDILDRSADWGVLVFLYMMEVVPLPPGKSRIRAWLDGFNHRLVPVADAVTANTPSA